MFNYGNCIDVFTWTYTVQSNLLNLDFVTLYTQIFLLG